MEQVTLIKVFHLNQLCWMARWTHTVGELETVSLENRKLKRKSDLNYEQAITGRNFLPFPQLSFNGQSGNLHDTDVLKQTQ